MDGQYAENAGAFQMGMSRDGWYLEKAGASRRKYIKKNCILVFLGIKT